MLDGQSCQMGICNQIGDRLSFREHLLKNGPVPFGRPDDPRTRLGQPALHAGKCLFERKRILEDPGISPYPDKCGQNCPAQTNDSSPG